MGHRTHQGVVQSAVTMRTQHDHLSLQLAGLLQDGVRGGAFNEMHINVPTFILEGLLQSFQLPMFIAQTLRTVMSFHIRTRFKSDEVRIRCRYMQQMKRGS